MALFGADLKGSGIVVGAISLLFVGCTWDEPANKAGTPAPDSTAAQPVQPAPVAATVMKPFDPTKVPAGEMGDAIRRGKLILEQTYETLPENVGNGLHCTSCHLDGGTTANAGPWIGLPGIFPEYRSRSGRLDTLPRRINDCFERSMNGKALDPGSEDMAAILAYMSYISRGVPSGESLPGRGFKKIDPPRTPDRAAGEKKYATLCASCHGPTGAGVYADGKYVFPPVWGDRSFNIGAGMARLDTAAAFIRGNMPRGAGGTVSEQDAYDIADFMIHQPRPDFPGKERDWPRGGKPRDARY